MKKRISALLLALALLCALAFPASAYDMGKAGENNIISAGIYHAGFINKDSSLWMWGNNEYDQLGNNGIGNATTEDNYPIQTVPAKVLDSVTAVSCGGVHTAAIRTDGSLWTWGWNEYSQLGNGSTTKSSTPVKVLDNVAAVSCGEFHTAAIKTDGSLWMWGLNLLGQLGNGTTTNSSTPVKVLDNVAAVSCGTYHTAAIKTDGSLWMWGNNRYGQLGNGGGGNAKGENSTSEFGAYQTVPVKVLDSVAAISCGVYCTAAIKTDGSLWMWGWNGYGVLGNGSTEDSYVPVKMLDNVAAVNFGNYHTAAIKTDGSLWMWGGNDRGQLGNGGGGNAADAHDFPFQTVPVKILDNVAAVSCGATYTSAVKADGSLWTWGENRYGQLGYADGNVTELFGRVSQTVPKQVTGLTASVPSASTAYASTQSVEIDGRKVEFQMYALKDANGNDTNYIKLRDLAYILNGTAAQFEVGWDGAVNIEPEKPYTANGSEMSTPFSGDRAYKAAAAVTNVNGAPVDLEAITLTDDQGGAYTYYKLRDLGAAIGFTVDWSAERGIYIETR